MPLRKKTWIVLADAARARIFVHDRADEGLIPVDGAIFDNPNAHGHTRDLGTDRPGRSVESVGGARHAQQPRTDLHRQAKLTFAKAIAEYVEGGARQKTFKALILIAPPQMLGDLRAALGKQSAEVLVGTIGKDLTKHPLTDIAEIVRSKVRL